MSCLTCDCSSEYSLTSTQPVISALKNYVKNFNYDLLRRLNTFTVIRDGSFFDNNDNTRNRTAAKDGKFWNRTWHDNNKNPLFIEVEHGLLALEFGDVVINNLEECDGKIEAYIIIADSPTRDNEVEPEVLYEFLQEIGIDVYSYLKEKFYNNYVCIKIINKIDVIKKERRYHPQKIVPRILLVTKINVYTRVQKFGDYLTNPP